MTGQTLLVVEDEESYVEALTTGLEREGFRIAVARDGREALTRFDEVHPDLVLLDLMLPEISGMDVCRILRARSTVPIIMVTARDAEVEKVVGLELGADDYVTKPYGLRELVARIHAVLRRAAANGHAADAGASTADAVEVGGVRFDVDRHEVTVDGREIRLALREFQLLEQLIVNAGRVVTRERLLDEVWGLDFVGDARTLDVHVKRLRGKLEPDPSRPQRITTVRGLGYRFERPRTPEGGRAR